MTQNVTVHFSSDFQQYTINRTESYEQETVVSTLVRFKNFALLYSRVGAGAAVAGAASKFLPGVGAA
jgi:TctA family transporter